MKKYLILFITTTIVLLGALLFMLMSGESSADNMQKKTVFMDSYRVFEEFLMKKDYDKRLETELAAAQSGLDSLAAELNAALDPLKVAALKKDFTVRKLAFDEQFNRISQQYTSEVYARLNDYIKAYGKKHSCGIILGSNGQGNVMYVDKGQDITKDLIAYINERYSN